MEAPSLERVWRQLLPLQISFSAGVEPASVRLSPTERRSLPGAGALRLREFAAGRWHAKRALAGLGCRDVDLPRRADGAPAWPDGVVGSVAHAWHGERVHVIAAVVQAGAFAALGVDLEPPGLIEPRAWPALLSSAQLDRVLALPVAQRGDAVRALWCVKEAVAKAGGAARELSEIEIALDPGSGRFAADGQVGRVVQEAGWTFAAALRFAPGASADWP
ncbi:MAG: 4'-phosphopantetheinyl transferase superfamily protein [Burkholderiales bacterium]